MLDCDVAEGEATEAHFVWQYFRGGTKNAVCMFCNKVLCGLSTYIAAAHILACPVMGKAKAGILLYSQKKYWTKPCVLKNSPWQKYIPPYTSHQTIS